MSVNVHEEELAIQEIVVFLRNQDIFSTTVRGVTTVTEVFVGNGILTEFTVSHLNIKNVRSVAGYSYGTDYLVNYSTGVITFTTAPSGNISVQYDYGTDKIYPEQARVDLKLNSYPRISVATTSVVVEDGALDGNVNYTDYLFSFYAYADKTGSVRGYIKSIKEAILKNKKEFYYLRYITPISETGIIQDPNRNDKIVTKVLECIAPLNEEIITHLNLLDSGSNQLLDSNSLILRVTS